MPWEHPAQGGEPSVAHTAANRAADAVFLSLLDKFLASGRDVGNLPGSRYAPLRFAEEKEAKLAKLGKEQLKASMNRLFDDKTIVCEEVSRAGRPVNCIRRNRKMY